VASFTTADSCAAAKSALPCGALYASATHPAA
jgi:hypothetical protein